MTDGIIRAARLFDGTGASARHARAVVIRDGRIADTPALADAPRDLPMLAEAHTVTPSLIDLQVNGGGGVLFNDAPDPETLRIIAAAAAREGAAHILPTFITDAGTRYARAIDAVRTARATIPSLLGLHLEGPFLSPGRPGIHPVEAIRPPDDADLATLTAAGLPLLVTLAPEICGVQAIHRLTKAGIRVFAGHTEARAADMIRAEAAGLAGVTHLFNAMSQITPREPGTVGATFAARRLRAGIIADGVHVHPANLALALRMLGPERLFLVSDAMAPLGSDIRTFELLGKTIHRRDGRLIDAAGTLAGADLGMAQAVRRMDRLTGCGLARAVQMATETPARVMGLQRELGGLRPGMRASLTLFDDGMRPTGVLVDGVPAGA
ncbi:N-acetylglucosamine-6-phosphate deacetylase [Citreimonas sp.]|uniref:N-acetylglucosamine-6-phosphate deacetylase n=1 Tax=Citreimonas sp. TaxID=3036715 RepID=UPI00405848B6